MITTILLSLLAIFTAIVFTFIVAFFSGSETAIISINRLKLKLMADGGFQNAKILQKMMEEQELLVSSMLVGLNIFVILGSTIITAILLAIFGPENKTWAVAINTMVMTPIFLIFGELIPKTIFRQNANRLALKHVHKIRFTYRLLYYVVRHVTVILVMIKKIFGGGRKQDVSLSKHDIQILIEMSEEEGILDRPRSNMIQSIFQFSDLPVRDVMTPRSDITGISIDDSLDSLIEVARAVGYSRIPVYQDDIDHIVGFLYIRDLFGMNFEGKSVSDLVRECKFIPESKPLGTLLKEMQLEKVQMAIVMDEYGGTAGLCTMEDIVEEIVGDIRDEFDKEEPDLQALAGNVYMLSGGMDLEDFWDEFNLDEDSTVESKSIGGFIVEKLGRVPSEGEVLFINGLKFIIERVDKRRIFKVKYVLQDKQVIL
jgi:putative hemolysin